MIVKAYTMAEARKITDQMDTKEWGSIVVARNWSFILAEQLGLTHFLMFEDDYRQIAYRWPFQRKNGAWALGGHQVSNLDKIFNATMDFMDSIQCYTVCFSQAGDFIGGVEAFLRWKNKSRKAMNSFFLRVDRPFKFLGRMNDDVNAYSSEGSRGGLFLTVRDVSVDQMLTQSGKGGLTDMYLENGTYVKSFYSVICQPSCCSIIMLQENHKRIHHQVEFNYCVPKIIPEIFKKSDNKVVPIVYEHKFNREGKI